MVGGVKQLLLILAVVVLVGGCASTPKVIPNSPEAKAAIEAAIRKAAKKPTGELTQADLEKVTRLNLGRYKLTDVKGLENLMQLKVHAGGKFSDGFMATPAVTGNALILRTKSAVYRVER
tara:strand:- start:858 stop:1217 length:360 start_codon:yes stop_codon:yes gene_type:complete